MFLEFAPLEGVTGAAFRKLHHQYFPGVDRYFTPFFSPTQNHFFTPRELREIAPENNPDCVVVPQLLTKNAEDFLWMAGKLKSIGYDEVNLNVGCPSGTVTAKGKGSGMLKDLPALDAFLEEVFENAPCKVSVKTRLGLENPEEFEAVLEIYNKYPLAELIIHPRVRQDFYSHPVREAEFEKALQRSKNPVSHNGGLTTKEDYVNCAKRYPALHAVMIGQGLTADPFLAGKIKGTATGDKRVLRTFHDELYATYVVQFGSRKNAIMRMKELWRYMLYCFADSDKHRKKLLKSKTPEEFELNVESIFRELSLLEDCPGGW